MVSSISTSKAWFLSTLLVVFFSSLYIYRFPVAIGVNITLTRFFVIVLIALFPLSIKKLRIVDLRILMIMSLPVIVGLADIFRTDYQDFVLGTFYTEIEKLTIFFSVYLVASSCSKMSNAIRKAFALSSLLPSLVVLMNAFEFYLLSITPALPFSAFLPNSRFYRAGSYYNSIFRFSSTFQDSNFFGLFCILVILVTYSLLIETGCSRNWRRVYLFLLVANHINLLLTFSITSYIVLSSMYFLLFVWRVFVKRQFSIRKLIRIFVIVPLLIIGIYMIAESDLRIVSQIRFRITLRNEVLGNSLLGDRALFFLPALDAIVDHPFFGIGKGNFWNHLPSAAIPVAHNIFLTALVDHGFVLGIASLSWLLLILIAAIRSRNFIWVMSVTAYFAFSLSYVVDYEALYVVWGIILASYYRRY